jgi:hypothetical protein
MTGFIRYMAATDDSPHGVAAREYLGSLLRIAPVRIVSMTERGLAGRWTHFMSLLGTPVTGTFVNVVSCAPERWAWRQSVPAPICDSMGAPTETISGDLELYTAGVRNVLLVGGSSGIVRADVALKYEAVVVADPYVASKLEHPHATLVGIPVTDHHLLRRAVLGL